MTGDFNSKFYVPPNFFRPGFPKRWYRPGTVYRFVLENGEYNPIIIDNGEEKPVVWAPMDGSQIAFLESPEIEVLLEGNRGGGKTDTALMDFYQHVNRGYGSAWRGILFRQTHPMLQYVIQQSKKWYKRLCPKAFYNEIKFMWEFPQGERLYLAHFDKGSDFDGYIGHSYSWICWEELARWSTPEYYLQMFSCLRSTMPGMPRKVRATTNPYGAGHNWIQTRWKLNHWPVKDESTGLWKVVGPRIEGGVDEKTGLKEASRRVIHSDLYENKLLMHTDPEYLPRISQSAKNESERQAWVNGSWDITAGGMFDDVWNEVHDIAEIDEEKIGGPFIVPLHWRIFRAYDHGSGKPYCCGFYAVSDGTDLIFPNGMSRATVRGDYFRVGEVYGWSGQPNEGLRLPPAEITKSIILYEIKRGWRPADGSSRGRVMAGPADTGIFDNVNNVCLADDMEKPVTINGVLHRGIFWERADKGPGSREQGWEQIRKRLYAVKRPPDGYRETPGLFIVKEKGIINHWIRTVPGLPRDEKHIDDVDTESEDHVGDECRYALRFDFQPVISRRV